MFWMSPSTWARWKSFNHQIFDRGVHNCFFFFFWKPSFSEPSFSIQYQSIISELKGEIGRLKDKVFFNIYIYLFYIISGSVYLIIYLYISGCVSKEKCFFRLTLVPPRALQLRPNSRWRNSKYWETRSWQTSGEILIFIYFLLFFLPLTQRADEAATPSDGDWQPHPGAHHGVRAAEYDCHTVGDGQSKVISEHFNLEILMKTAGYTYQPSDNIENTECGWTL